MCKFISLGIGHDISSGNRTTRFLDPNLGLATLCMSHNYFGKIIHYVSSVPIQLGLQLVR